MNDVIRRRWVRALRSGRYEQGRGLLKRRNRYCCLGVLCELYHADHKKTTHWETTGTVKPARAFVDDDGKLDETGLTKRVREWAGLDVDDELELTRLNDGHAPDGDVNGPDFKPCNFKEIAHFIEHFAE
jgi:hypothetical protein